MTTTPAATQDALWARVVRGSAFEAAGHVTAQAIRLASNLVLARLLFPEAFGLAALITVFNQGLVMLSDVGLGPSIVQNPRGDEPRFLNTAWTIQVLRGVALYAISLLLTWPAAWLYDRQLLWLMPVGSLQVLILGFTSTSIFTLNRRLMIGISTLIDIGSQVLSVGVMIVYGLFSPTVWVLVAGGLAGGAVKAVASHFVEVGYRNRLAWDRESASEILSFGKWIFGSSVLSFLSSQGDRLLLGRLMGMTQLGVYSIVVTLADAIGLIVIRITRRVLFPVFAEVKQEGIERLRAVYYRARLGIDALAMPALGLLSACSDLVIGLLYDSRYAGAGWMLELLALRVLMSSVAAPCEMCLMALAMPKYSFFQNVGRILWVFSAVPIGFHFWGLRGIVWAAALSELPSFLVQWPALHRAGILRPSREVLSLAFFAAGWIGGELGRRLFGI